jgi:hypothetical protein
MQRKMLEVLSARDGEGRELTLVEVRADWTALKAAHERALASEPTWAMFGGVLTVNGHEYQVS